MSAFSAAAVGLFVFNKIAALLKKDGESISKGIKADSLIDYTQTARVEPIVLIDADCLYCDFLSDVQQSLLSIFTGYYLQAVAISMNVGKINVERQLDKLNPRRDIGSSASSMGWLMANEAYKDKLPKATDIIALEDIDGFETKTHADAVAEARLEIDIDKFDHQKNQDFIKNLEASQKDSIDREKFDFTKASYYAQKELSEKEFNERVRQSNETYKINLKKMDADKAFREAQLDLQRKGLVLQEASRQDTLNRSEFGVGKDTFTTLKELSNLSVGKLFSVDITDGINKASIPMSVRLMASSMPTNNLIHILSLGSKDNSFKERYHLMKAGRIEFIRDFIFAQDLIDDYRKNLMNDKDGVYSNIVKRANTNKLAGLVSANPSVATASNLCIISASTAEQLELHLNGKLSNFKIRQRVFENTYLMILVVIDNSWRRATFYHRGINMPTEVSAQDLKGSNRNSGPDVADILSAYRAGVAPSL